jgi:hypothetical protein
VLLATPNLYPTACTLASDATPAGPFRIPTLLLLFPELMPDISEKEGSSTDDEEDGEENENDAMEERTLS